MTRDDEGQPDRGGRRFRLVRSEDAPARWSADELAFLRAFGRRVRLWRVYRAMSQEQLAEAAGMSRNFVSSVERASHSVDLLRVRRLAVALRVSLPELMADQPEGLPS